MISAWSQCQRCSIAMSWFGRWWYVVGGGQTHPLLSRLCDVPVRLEKTAEVDCLAAPEVSVDAPVERELQRLPVKAPAVRQFVRAAGGAGAAAYRTCFLELMATAALPVVCVAEGVCVMCGRNASLCWCSAHCSMP